MAEIRFKRGDKVIVIDSFVFNMQEIEKGTKLTVLEDAINLFGYFLCLVRDDKTGAEMFAPVRCLKLNTYQQYQSRSLTDIRSLLEKATRDIFAVSMSDVSDNLTQKEQETFSRLYNKAKKQQISKNYEKVLEMIKEYSDASWDTAKYYLVLSTCGELVVAPADSGKCLGAIGFSTRQKAEQVAKQFQHRFNPLD